MGIAGGVPIGPITVLFEVKNVRHWMYPASEEPYQLLHKAAMLQQEHPADRILPVLVCRRRHYWTYQLALHLGFFVIEVHEQYVLPVAEIDPAHFDEVRDELAYTTLRLSDGPAERLIQSLRDALPRFAVTTADRWAEVGSRFVDQYAILRDPHRSRRQRDEARALLRPAEGESDEEEPEAEEGDYDDE